MSGSTAVMDDFKTPDRNPSRLVKKEASAIESQSDISTNVEPVTVTPPESTAPKDEYSALKTEAIPLQMVSKSDSKPDSPGDSPSSTNSQRGLVSTRGRGRASPGRASMPAPSNKESTVLEFKTFRSPAAKAEESDTVPSLCSAGSHDNKDKPQAKLEAAEASSGIKQGDEKPSSISLDSTLNQTSPLAPEGSEKAKNEKKASSKKEKAGKNNVTFSPVPPAKENAVTKVSQISKIFRTFNISPWFCSDRFLFLFQLSLDPNKVAN